jgi:hypothetical protein
MTDEPLYLTVRISSISRGRARSLGPAAAFAIFACCAIVAALRADEAPSPAAPADPAIYGIDLTTDDFSHWAFRAIAPVKVPVPDRDAEWAQNPIDAFVLEKLHAKGLGPSRRADDRTWLRRVSFDLVGLPPTPEQLESFLCDQSAARRERVVDRLLADPNYGIRWGRRWLDVVRYADTNGYERDGDKPHAWRYRDYVVSSLNDDKPFDRFLTEHLAGDELDEGDAETMIATTFLRLGTWDDEPADPTVDRYDQLDDIVGTVSATFLGLTLRCARCHNHKFEPLSQLDYGRMLSIFEPLQRPQNDRIDLDLAVGTRAELADNDAAVARHDAAVAALKEQIASLDTLVRERYFGIGQTKLPREAYEAHKLAAASRTAEQTQLAKETQKQFDEELAASRTADETSQREAFAAAMKSIERAAPNTLPRAYIWREPRGSAPVTQVFRRGSPTAPAGTVVPGFPAVLEACQMPFVEPEPESRTTLRRLSLARWMTGPKNPLVARVIVNRLWQGHFGEGLVSTENDFGVMGNIPSHPGLLDWLAHELREPSLERVDVNLASSETPPGPPLRRGGRDERPGHSAVGRRGNDEPRGGRDVHAASGQAWRLKRIHKLIVLSNTYAQSSDLREEAAKADVDNTLLWRFPYRRLEAEAVRDSVLAVSARLDQRMGGPGVYPKIAREVLEGQSRPGLGWGKFDEREALRRSIYVFVKRSLLLPEMELLDFADTTTSCEQRPVSTIPTQALTLLNGEFLNEEARHFAARLVREAGAERRAQVDRAFRLAICRPPTAEEQLSAQAFLERQAQRIVEEDRANAAQPPRDPLQTALEALCLVLYNLNEFVYVD